MKMIKMMKKETILKNRFLAIGQYFTLSLKVWKIMSYM